MNLTVSTRGLLAAGGLFIAMVQPALADVSWKNIQFGGFASQGFLASSANDYLGETSHGTFDFREYAVNTSYATGHWRVGGQVFGQKLGVYGNDKIKLDWATVDYQATQWFGLRIGQVKMPRGLYNESLDLDSVRPFVLLPQSVYDNRLRDFNASFRGGMIYGNIGLRRAGSLDYRAFYGNMHVDAGSGALDYFHNDQPFLNESMKIDDVIGGSLFWNSPLTGLRGGYSYSSFRNTATSRFVFPPPPLVPLRAVGRSNAYDRHLLSLEYLTGDWVFAAEAGRSLATISYFANDTGPRVVTFDFKSDYWYVSAARRINHWLELGTYYSYSRDEQPATYSVLPALPDNPTPVQGDYALSARFDLNEHVLFKLEGHYMDGAGKIFDTYAHRQPIANRDNSWTMIAAKITFSF
jgi:hypothetical protein